MIFIVYVDYFAYCGNTEFDGSCWNEIIMKAFTMVIG